MTETNEAERAVPALVLEGEALKWARGKSVHCNVRHPDAGGQCRRPAAMEVCGLAFCEAHGEEAKAGALAEVYHDAAMFFERFRNPHVPRLNPVVELELEEATGRMNRGGWATGASNETQRRAYPERRCPEHVRARVVNWELDEAPGYAPVADRLLQARHTLNKLMRQAHQEGETWLVEVLEYERESVAAQAAYAMRDRASEAEESAG